MALGSQQVIIDDRNTDFVTYTGPWSQQGGSVEFNGTTSAPTAPGANVTLQFNGTAFAIYGSYGQGGNSTEVSIYIDGGDPWGASYGAIDNQGVWTHFSFFALNVSEGTHTVTTSITTIGHAADGVNANMFIDYFVVTQCAGTPVDRGVMSFFDDTDPAFQYSGPWTAMGTVEDMQTTIHGALAMNSSAMLSFSGSFVNVYGSIPLTSSVGAIAQFVIDNGPPFIALYPPVQNISIGHSGTSTNLRLYHNSSLSPGPHVMVITPLAEEVLWIDYATSGNGTDTTNPGDTVVDVLSLNIPPATLSASSSGGHSNVLGDIVGGVVGSLAGLVVLALLIILYLRRKRTLDNDMEKLIPHQIPLPDHLQQAESPIPSNDPRHVTPYDFKYDHVVPSSPGNTGLGNVGSDNERGKGVASTSRVSTQSESAPASTSTITNPFLTPVASSSTLTPPSPPTIQHRDSGIRGLEVPETIVEVPPLYSED